MLGQTPHQPGVQLLPSLLSGAPRVSRCPLRVCHARYAAPCERHAQRLTSRKHRARAYRVASSVRRTGRTRACDARVGAGRFMTPARVFPMCTRQFTIHVMIDVKHTQHARHMERRVLVPTGVRVVLHEALCHAHSGSPRDRRDATLYDAFALDTEPRRLAQRKASHRRRGARTSGHMLHARTGTNALSATYG